MDKDSAVLVLGATGMVGRAVVLELERIGVDPIVPERCGDLTASRDCSEVFSDIYRTPKHTSSYVFMCAGMVGGISSNREHPAHYGHDNASMMLNVVTHCWLSKAKLLYLGSSCIYPRDAVTPTPESALLSGPLEPTNEMYALAKILGVKMCDAYRKQYGSDFISAMPCNLYGPYDNYGEGGHVVAAVIHKLHEAKDSGADSVTFMGDGTPQREFMHVDDLARGLVHLMKNYSDYGPVNIGPQRMCSIKTLAEAAAHVIGYKGEILFDGDTSKNGTPAKMMDSSKMRAMGWQHQIGLPEGLEMAYQSYLKGERRG